MNIAIISSSKDKASMNIKESLISNFNFKKLEEKFDNNSIYRLTTDDKIIKICTINSELIHAESIDKSIGADLFIFISKHSAKEERKSLTVHVTGNFGKAEHGGKEKTLCTAPSIYMKNILADLNKNSKNSGYEATMEATHHGPFIEKPLLFVEIGSSEKEWEDKEAGNIVAQSIISAIKKDDCSSNNDNPITISNESINKINNNKNNNLNNKNFNALKNKSEIMINNNNYNEKNLIIINNKSMNKNNNSNNNGNSIKNNYESIFVIGGSHYNYAASKAMLKTNFAVGHICAKYNLESLDKKLIKEAMEKAIPKSKLVLLDWKGLGREKKRIMDLLEKNNIKYKRSDKD